MTDLTPREIVSELDRFIIGQADAKRAVAVALRNRWRRKQLADDLRDEVYPKNILMIGPTGVGKTEISRRLAKLAKAPFIKVEATKFTEVGYVGRDVEQIIRDLVDAAIIQTRDWMREDVKAKAHQAAEDRVIAAIAGEDAREGTRDMFRKKLKDGLLDDTMIELELTDHSNPMGMMDIPGQPGSQMGMMNLGDIFGKAFGGRTVRKRMSVRESYDVLISEEADKLLDDETVNRAALEAVEQNGIVFLDEIESMPLALQTRLLRVIQEREVEVLGHNAPRPLDVRFVAATKSDLKALGEKGEFRSDLYYRLAASELDLPPLRDRGDDVIALFGHFASEESARSGLSPRPVPEAVLSSLLAHDWPGNVRELKSLATRFALGLSDGMPGRTEVPEGDAPGLVETMARIESGIIRRALKEAGGNRAEAARRLQIPRRTLGEKIDRLGIREDSET